MMMSGWSEDAAGVAMIQDRERLGGGPSTSRTSYISGFSFLWLEEGAGAEAEAAALPE